MYPCYFVVFDLETGGLITKTGGIPPITEFAAAVLNDKLETVEEVDFFIKPYKPVERYTAEALKVSNITLDLCEKQGVSALDASKQIADLFKKAKAPAGAKKTILCGHNIDSFDVTILNDFLTEFKVDLSKFVEKDCTIDTKWWGRIAYPELPGYTLSDCLMREKIDNEQAHRAIGDVRANRDLLVRMLQRLRGEAGLFAPTVESPRKNFRFQIARK